ncbi:uncharacterized protein PAN0_006d3075 [Moesziomyces antarcticus]|uniref:Uncharacterized protein n=1 Tax=Pseudozyma antarctica TaxID=84753 RepID=A0A081CDW3_PSEA2|nr:uncharacterized protein PAN0_006d3075 [Moesziomyces antarcticus]GAK64859.1 hypothetical protein PAN0_006d3075 [Moesziomyces antarcticus]
MRQGAAEAPSTSSEYFGSVPYSSLIIELAPGPDSRISASQACFYLLDALPLVFALAPYTLGWPSRVFPAISFRVRPPVPSGEDTISKLPLTHTPYQHA